MTLPLDFWMDLATVCPDCGGTSVCFAHITNGEAVFMAFDHELGWTSPDAWRKHTKALRRWLREPAGVPPVGWRRLDGAPAAPLLSGVATH